MVERNQQIENAGYDAVAIHELALEDGREESRTITMTCSARGIDQQIKTMTKRLRSLLAAEPHDITQVANEKVGTASVSGVYAISARPGTEILYIGRNLKVTIAKRAWQHVNSTKGSNLKGMIKLYHDLPSALDEYRIRWIEILDAGERHFFEAFAIGVMKPRMNFKEAAQQGTGGDA